jgi:SNF2 family DNA or RNA helicase
MSYDKAVRGRDNLMAKDYDMIIADEAHKLREEDTLRFQELNHYLTRVESY